ncbi:MAG: M20/M25/M40 family metallo-hydrolase, partial [Deltaproteobacteria bacterium]|nr:M20/M25/M40 family metallo-hydrolase [Deltaproteobacteria bacterium]
MKKPRLNRFTFISALSVFLLFCISSVFPVLAGTRDVLNAVDAVELRMKSVADRIHNWMEPGSKEFKSSKLLMDELRKMSYTVTGDLLVPADLVEDGVAKTAFKAELKGKRSGPTITIMLEYDALPHGHACGHNLIAGSGMLAAAALAKLMPNLPGTVRVVGTPDEERGSLGG